MNLGRSSLKLFISQAGRSILLFAGIIYFTRTLPPNQLGSFFLYQAMLGLLTIPADMGIRGGLEKRLSEGDDPASTMGAALVLKLTLLLFVSVIILLLRGHVNEYLGAELAIALIVGLVVHEFWEFYVHTLRGELRVGETALIRLALRVVSIGVGAYLITVGFGTEGLVAGLILGGLVAAGWGAWKSQVRPGWPTRERIRSLVEYSKYHAVTNIGGTIYQYMDIAVIGFFLTQRHVSAYEVAWQVTLTVLLISKSIAWSLFPQISQWDAEAAVEKIESSISVALGFAMFVAVPAVVGGAVFASEILGFIFGPEYTIAYLVLVVLLVEKSFQSFNDIVESSVRALNRPDLAAKATVASVCLNLILNPIFVMSFGIVGAALATTISWSVNTAMHTRFLRSLVNFEFPVRLVGWYTLASIVMGVILFALKSAVPVTNVQILVGEIAIGVAVYFAATVTVPEVRKQIIIPGVRVLT